MERFLSDECSDDPVCSASLFDIYRKAIEELSRFPPPNVLGLLNTPQSYFDDHGATHLERVQEYADQLIDMANVRLNCCEALLLLLSVWSHDIGMLYKLDKLESIEDAREKHHERAMDILSQIQKAEGLSKVPAVLESPLTSIIAAHRRSVDISFVPRVSVVYQREIRTRLLGAILRIADASDIDQRRAPEAIFELYKSAIPDPSKVYWLRHVPVAGVRYDPLRTMVCIHVLPPSGTMLELVGHAKRIHWVKEEFKDELDSVSHVFEQYRVPLFQVQLVDQTSGKLLDLERPPRERPYFLVMIDETQLSDSTLAGLEEALKQHLGDHNVVLELMAGPSARLFVVVPGLAVKPESTTITAARGALGNAWVACQILSPGAKEIPVVTV